MLNPKEIQALAAAVLLTSMVAACTSTEQGNGGVSERKESGSAILSGTDSSDKEAVLGVLRNQQVQPLRELTHSPTAAALASKSQAELEDSAYSSQFQPRAIKSKRLHLTQVQPGFMPRDGFYPEAPNTENYGKYLDNPIKLTQEHPVSTFSIDVDTGSYSNVRRMLKAGLLPVKDAVRIEELVNYFDYAYASPTSTDAPFSIHTELATSPWNEDRVLLHLGLQGYDINASELPASNLVFLVDVSGSMAQPNKLGLLKSSLQLLSKKLTKKDRVSIVVYAGASGVVLDSVAGNNQREINAALEQLRAGGSTNGAAGIQQAYSLARKNFIEGGNNRVILATDGDFNVGLVNFDALKDLVAQQHKSGVALTSLGFGTGNYNDHLMEQIADVGNGNYAYIDSMNEARKVLVDQLTSTLFTIAKDVKIQIEFNPAWVKEYRLIGYENRLLKREDFNNDKVDAGDIGAGHSVTALYELTLANAIKPTIDPIRYNPIRHDSLHHNNGRDTQDNYRDKQSDVSKGTELAFVKLRYKTPESDFSELVQLPIYHRDIYLGNSRSTLADRSESFRFAVAVAGFGQLLRDGKFANNFDYDALIKLANSAKGRDDYGYRAEFISLLRTAQALSG